MTEGKRQDEKLAYRSFIVSISLAIVFCFFGIFFGMALRNDALIRETLLARARSIFQEIVLTRKWNALFGGVYVIKGPGVETNPYLVDPELKASDGRVLTKRNPSLMTKEISEIAAKEASFRFRITSLKPLNPENAPDAFEQSALESFESGKAETWKEFEEAGKTIFRYMGKLDAEESCLQCHAIQGYKVGDIRGGISVSFGIEEISKAQKLNILAIIATGIIVSGGLLWLVIGFFKRLKKNLDFAREELREAAIKDGLTSLFNRRHIMERFNEEFSKAKRLRTQLSCAIVDVDDFKKVNDELGHLRGDAVLKGITATMKDAKRPYDLLGRFGGEEFIIIFPGAEATDALAACNRIRQSVSLKVPAIDGLDSRAVSVSIGVSALASNDESTDALLARADAALYRAKAAGKNRCELFEVEPNRE